MGGDMVEGMPENPKGSQIPPLLRQRMLNRAATFSEGAQVTRPMDRRRSSILSDLSDSRQSFFRPGGKDKDALESLDEPTVWYSAPLAFAILPAVGGLFSQNGNGFVTDILLLGLGAMFLNWCVRAPWDWYHAAQQAHYTEIEETPPDDTIAELDERDENMSREGNDTSPVAATPETVPPVSKDETPTPTDAQKYAGRQLTKQARMALLACFLGPIMGAYMLHAIRSQLTRPAEGLVSNYNLTIFTMAAELRPVAHVMKLKQARIVHLQRIARTGANNQLGRADADQLSQRLADVEAHLAEPVIGSGAETAKLSATIHQSLQPQLDALNRAVRRYEKRQVAQSIQTEARFEELETRLKDALALAAAAARTGQRPGILSIVSTWTINFAAYVIHTTWATATYPYRVVATAVSDVKSWFVKGNRQPRKRIKR